MPAAPHQFEAGPTRIDRRDVGGSAGVEGAGEGVTVALRQVGVGIAQVEGEHLVGEADANIPGVIAGVGDAIREWPSKAWIGEGRPVERIGGSEPLPSELAGDIHADAAGAKGRARRGVFAGDRRVVAPGAGVQEVRRIVLVDPDLPVVVDRVIHLAVDFEEAHVLLHDVAVGQGVGRAFRAERVAGGIGRGAEEAGSARIQVAPDTEVEGERTEGRADTAVDVDFGGGAIRERDALGRGADVKLQILADVVAGLEIGRHRGVVVRLRDAAKDVIVHHGGAERDIPGIKRRRRRRLDGFHGQVCRESRTRDHCQRRCQQNCFLHGDPHHISKKSVRFRTPPGQAIID